MESQMLRAQMITPEPVAAGTRFQVTFCRGVGEALIEDTKIDRLRSWTAIRSRALNARTEGQIHDTSLAARCSSAPNCVPTGSCACLPRPWAVVGY